GRVSPMPSRGGRRVARLPRPPWRRIAAAQVGRGGRPPGDHLRRPRGRGPREAGPSRAQPVLQLRGLRFGLERADRAHQAGHREALWRGRGGSVRKPPAGRILEPAMSERRSVRGMPFVGMAAAGVVAGHWLAYVLAVPASAERARVLIASGHGYWSLAIKAA